MSQMRQRKGAGDGGQASSASASSSSGMKSGEPEISDQEAEQRLLDTMAALRKPKVIGLSHNAKSYKDVLEKEPYNIEAIWKLGEAYAADEQWPKVTNILQRGRKLVKGLPETEQMLYLMTLCEGVLTEEDYPDALAVFEQVPPPALEDEQAKRYTILACQVFCQNGDMTRGLKSFQQSIDGESFENAAAIYVIVQPALMKCGANELAHNMIQEMITSDEMQQRFDVLQKLSEMRVDLKQRQNEEEGLIFGYSKFAVYTFVVLMVVVMLVFAFILETKSLESWEKIRKSPPDAKPRR